MPSVIVVNKNSSREVALQRAVSVIGRDGGVAVELGDLQVSRRHALLVQARAGFFVKDLGSRNGLTINKQRLPSRTQAALRNGDVLALGRTTLIFKDLGIGEEEAHDPTVNVPVVQPVGQAPADEPLELEQVDPAVAEEPRRPTPKAPRRLPPPRRKKKPNDERIPRAMAPQDNHPQVYSGQAEILALRALVERSERDRSYYRNLSLILFGLLVLTLILVFAWALLQGSEPEARSGQVTPMENSGPAPRAPQVAALDRLDHGVFARSVQPVLSERCASCHEGVGRGGDLVIAKSNDAQTVDANLAAVARFVVPGAPEHSPLLLAPLGEDEGGTPGKCGQILVMDAPEWQAMRAWVAGEAAVAAPRTPAGTNRPPAAQIEGPSTVLVGEAVTLSADGSSDPEGSELSFRWTLLDAPQSSTASVDGAEASQARLVPDVAGRYVLALVVRDGAATGSTEHSFTAEAGAPAPDPRRGVRLTRICQDLLGRGATPQELAQLEGKSGDELRAFFLGKDEVYKRWWDAELHYLGLTGANRPQGEPWDSLPARLESGRYTVQNAYYALLVGQNWSARYPGREAYVGAVLEKVLGPEKERDAALREAGHRLYDGHESTLLGKRTKGQIGLVKVAVGHSQAKLFLLRRSHRNLTGGEPGGDVLRQAAVRLEKEPTAFFAILVDWACRGL